MNRHFHGVLSAILVFHGLSVGAAISQTGVWTAGSDNTPESALAWFNPENWENGIVPNGATWGASVLANATGKNYIRIDRPLTLGKVTSKIVVDKSLDQVTFLSDCGVTIADAYYQMTGGRWFADLSSPAGTGVGALNNTEYDGRITAPRYTSAGGAGFIRLFNFASSANPVRTDDFVVDIFYRGSGTTYIYGPRNGAAHAEEWTVTPGLPFVSRTEPAPTVAAGAVVSAPGIFPEGTFVKRIFDDRTLELSAPAAETAAAGAANLSFSAITPHARIVIPVMQMATWYSSYLSVMKPAEDCDFELEIKDFVSLAGTADQPYNYCPHCPFEDFVPAKVIIHDAAHGNGNHANARYLNVELGRCFLEFAETGREDACPGFPDSTACTFKDALARHVSTLSVPSGLTARIGQFTNFFHVVEKVGNGALWLGLTNDVARNTGTLVVKEGTVELPAGAWVKTVAVSNGATLKVSGTFAPEQFEFEAGARIAGGGTLVLPANRQAALGQLVVDADTGVRIAGGSGPVLLDPPTYEVVGNPAFWVDASQTSTMAFKDDDGVSVTRWNDIRKTSEDDGYMYASTEVFSSLPCELVTDGAGTPHVFFQRIPAGTDVTTFHELGWCHSITNIRAVFMAQSLVSGGGQLLGASRGLATLCGGGRSDWVRDGGAGYTGDVFYRGNVGVRQKALIASPLYQNGFRSDPLQGYMYGGASAVNVGVGRYVYPAQVTDVHPTFDAAADCFATDPSLSGRNGNKRVFEMIIYTNALTQAERVAVEGYLMRKWVKADVSYATSDEALGRLTVADVPRLCVAGDENLVVGELAGSGSFVKEGDGLLVLENLGGPSLGLDVAGGVVKVPSRQAITSVAQLPANPRFHLDAADADHMALSDNRVTTWTSRGADATPFTAIGSPLLVANALNGLPMVDFGTAVHGSGRGFSFVRENGFRSLFMVQNTAQGGLPLFGNATSYSYEGIARGNWYTQYNQFKSADSSYVFSPSDPLVASDYSGGVLGFLNKEPRSNRTRLNGEWIDPSKRGYSGGNDLLSFRSFCDISSDRLGISAGHGMFADGGMLGECIAYTNTLSDADALKVEAYLRKRWFNQDTPGFIPASVRSLSVAAGAALEVYGGAPLTISESLSGGGSVVGSLTLAQGISLNAPVNADGTVSGLVVNGEVNAAGAEIVVSGDFGVLRPGVYPLISATAINAEEGTEWRLVANPTSPGKRILTCKAEDGVLKLIVALKGFVVNFR